MALADTLQPPGPVKRLTGAGYMELDVEAGAFSCGTCQHHLGGYCGLLRAYVDTSHGCCNAFYPERGRPRDSSKWAASK